ncbi:MAG: hypothetical protein IJS53_01160 [Clostridia bacterium]|nr:hypothetical protein [Clostridia bacterium]
MRGRVLFACLFVAALWMLLHAYAHAPAKAAALPAPALTLQAPASLPEQEEETPAPSVPSAQEEGADVLRPSPRPAEAPTLRLPFYRAAWQAFHIEGSAG